MSARKFDRWTEESFEKKIMLGNQKKKIIRKVWKDSISLLLWHCSKRSASATGSCTLRSCSCSWICLSLRQSIPTRQDEGSGVEWKKTLLDRMVQLLTWDDVFPMVSYIHRYSQGEIRHWHFTHYLLCYSGAGLHVPPYTSDFLQLFLPIFLNDSIVSNIKMEGKHGPLTECITHCKFIFMLLSWSWTNSIAEAEYSSAFKEPCLKQHV